MRTIKKRWVLLIILLAAGTVIAATLESAVEQCGVLNHGLRMCNVHPESGSMSDDDMAALLGLQDPDMLAPGGASGRINWIHHHHH